MAGDAPLAGALQPPAKLIYQGMPGNALFNLPAAGQVLSRPCSTLNSMVRVSRTNSKRIVFEIRATLCRHPLNPIVRATSLDRPLKIPLASFSNHGARLISSTMINRRLAVIDTFSQRLPSDRDRRSPFVQNDEQLRRKPDTGEAARRG